MHFSKGALARLRPSYDTDMMRLLLVHETAHAVAHENYPHLFRGDSRLGATLREGHAQIVTMAVARAWGIQGAFDKFHAQSTKSGVKEFWRKAYVDGYRFFVDVWNEAGDKPMHLIHAVMKNPPQTLEQVNYRKDFDAYIGPLKRSLGIS